MVGKVKKRRRGGRFLTLKNQRNEWAQQNHSSSDLRAIDSGNVADSVARRTIAHLIVILNVAKKAMLRQQAGVPAVDTIAIARVNAIVNKGLSKCLGQLRERAEVGVVASSLAWAKNSKERMMEIVAPLRADAEAAGLMRSHHARIV